MGFPGSTTPSFKAEIVTLPAPSFMRGAFACQGVVLEMRRTDRRAMFNALTILRRAQDGGKALHTASIGEYLPPEPMPTPNATE